MERRRPHEVRRPPTFQLIHRQDVPLVTANIPAGQRDLKRRIKREIFDHGIEVRLRLVAFRLKVRRLALERLFQALPRDIQEL